MVTNQELLDKVNAAIDAKMTGGAVASYRIGDVNIQYASLRELQELRKGLAEEVRAGKNTRNYVSFGNP